MSLRILSASDVQQVIETMSAQYLIELATSIFRQISKRDGMITPNRLSITTDKQTSLFMPSHVSTIGTAVKIVSVPQSGEGGLPASTLLLDQDTGRVKAMINARKLTALRTAAGSALASKLLSNPESKYLVVFGAGAQIEEHASLLLSAFPSLEWCCIVNRSDNQRLADTLARLRNRHHHTAFEAIATSTIPELELELAVRKADIICTATSSTSPLFRCEWVKPGTHLNLIGSYKPFMCEVSSQLIRRARGRIVVDSAETCLSEAGELIHAGCTINDVIELGALVDTEGKFTHELDVTIFKSVGVGAQDIQIAAAVHDVAEKMGLGTVIHEYD